MKMQVRDATLDDRDRCVDWMLRIQDINLMDPSVFAYPATRTLCAYDENGPQLYVPRQVCLVLDALAPRPDSEGKVEALSLLAVIDEVSREARALGIGEIMFLCKDGRVIEFATRKRTGRTKYRFDVVIGHWKDGVPDYEQIWLLRMKVTQ